jgi:hypothetical protein
MSRSLTCLLYPGLFLLSCALPGAAQKDFPYGLIQVVPETYEAVVCLFVALLQRSVHYAAVKTYLTRVQSFLSSHKCPHRVCA